MGEQFRAIIYLYFGLGILNYDCITSIIIFKIHVVPQVKMAGVLDCFLSTPASMLQKARTEALQTEK